MKQYFMNSEAQNILFVNKNEFDFLVFEALLGKKFNIIEASNVKQILFAFDFSSIDIVVINQRDDSNLKERIAILKKIRLDERFSQIKLYALTNADNAHKHTLIKQGFDGVFTKPLIKEELTEALAE